MSETRTFTIRANGEWGIFFLLEGVRDGHHWCVLSIVSAFGNYGYRWSSMGTPAAQFLAKIQRDYACEKLAADRSHVFDGEATERGLREWLIRKRKDGMPRSEARELWNAIGETDFTSETAWLISMPEDLQRPFYECECRQREELNPQFVGLWRDLWPTFVAELRGLPQVAA